MQSRPKQTTAVHPQAQARPVSNILTLDALVENPDFRDFWSTVLKGIRQFGMNEAMLVHMHAAKVRKGNIDAVNAQAALDMHKLEGSLEVWDILLSLLDQKVESPELDDDSDEQTSL